MTWGVGSENVGGKDAYMQKHETRQGAQRRPTRRMVVKGKGDKWKM